MKSGKLVLGVLAGVAIGAIAGILLAPEKGSKMRKRFITKGKEYVDGAKQKFDEMVGGISRNEEKIGSEAGGLITNGNNVASNQAIKNTVV